MEKVNSDYTVTIGSAQTEYSGDLTNDQRMEKAPIALFVYNRPWHTQQTIEALKKNEFARESDLFIFSDAPKTPEAVDAVQEVRRYINDVSGLKSIVIIERTENFGLAKSIIEGVTQICNEYGRVIVLEDDLVTSPYFLRFMNDALALYEDDEQVISIHGYQYPIRASLPETFFLKGADCWGWATWKRGWDLFEADGRVLLEELTQRKLAYSFDFDGTYPYTRMLVNQIKKKNNSWAIRWYASAFLRDRLTLYPGRSLVVNIGTDSTGTHCSTTDAFTSDISVSPVKVERIPVMENLSARAQIVDMFRSTREGLPIRVMRKLADMIPHAK